MTSSQDQDGPSGQHNIPEPPSTPCKSTAPQGHPPPDPDPDPDPPSASAARAAAPSSKAPSISNSRPTPAPEAATKPSDDGQAGAREAAADATAKGDAAQDAHPSAHQPGQTPAEDGRVITSDAAIQDWLQRVNGNGSGDGLDKPAVQAGDASAAAAAAAAAVTFDPSVYEILASLQHQRLALPPNFGLTTLNGGLGQLDPAQQPDAMLAPGQGFGLAWESGQIPIDDQDDESAYIPPNSYGSLELPDSTFFITTRTILIGRDQKAFLAAKKQQDFQRKCAEGAANGTPMPPTPGNLRSYYSKSYMSEEGGVLGPESDGEDGPRPAKRRKTGPKAQAQSSKQSLVAARDPQARIISSRQYVDHTPGAVPVDVDSLRPADDDVARLDIHGPGPDIRETTKGISRDHLRIQYNPNKRVWQATVLGRNGFFCQEAHYQLNDVVTLRCGDSLQIQGINFVFVLNGVKEGNTGAEAEPSASASRTYSEGGKEMSFDFQSSRGDEMRDTTTEGSDGAPDEALKDRVAVESDSSDDSDEEMADAPSASPEKTLRADSNEDAEDDIRETVESDRASESMRPETSPEDAERLAQLPFPLKKRGPGRPPKNGFMSKREERLLKKQAQEEAKKKMPPVEPGEQPQKRKVGRPRKHPLPENGEEQPEKRKYKPRKPKNEDGEDEADGEKPAKEKSQKHKTPPLELNRADFTEEQLQKPTKNYQLLIDEVMSTAPPKGYSLKQIYKRIQERWPFFFFVVDTKGWESSVRHNLLGSDCFKKIDGNWHRVPGVPLESGKKRKPSDAAGDPRPAPMYNGYAHAYQPPPHVQHHGHQQLAHSTGLSQPNLPPRFPPNGQAYQIHQRPAPGAAPSGGAPNHQAPVRPGFHQQQQQQQQQQQRQQHPNGYSTVGGPPRPQYPGNQQAAYNTTYANRPQAPLAPNQGTAGPAAAQNAAHRMPLARPGQGHPVMPQPGMQTSQTSAPMGPLKIAPSPHQQQPVLGSAPPLPLGPVIEPILRDFIREFRLEVIKQLQAKEGKRAGAVAMSVINRGLGLTDKSLMPECEAYEKLILPIFCQHKSTFPKRRAEALAKAAAASSAARPPPAGPPTGPSAANAKPIPGTATRIANGAAASNGAGGVTPGGAANAGVAQTTNGNATSTTPKPAPAPAPAVAATAAAAAATGPSKTAAVGAPAALPAAKGSVQNAPGVVGSSTPRPTNAGSQQTAPASTGSVQPRPAGAGPAPTTPAPAASGPPKPVPSGPAPSASSAAPGKVAPANSGAANGGAANARSSTASPATPLPGGSRSSATPGPGTPGPSDSSKDVQLLDPKLVSIILAFKKTILPTLAEKLGMLLGESLVMSAVDRLLGFTDETFVQAKDEQQKQHFAEAEKALMNALDARFTDYVKKGRS